MTPRFERAVIALLLVPTMATAAGGVQDQATRSSSAGGVEVQDAGARRALVRELAQRGSPETLGTLGRLVADPLDDIQAQAIDAVVAIYVAAPEGRRVRGAEDGFDLSPYRVVPYAAPPELVDGLVRALADNWPGIRRDAVYALGVVSTPPVAERVGDELVQSLRDREPAVRLAAARVLGRLRVTRAGLALIGGVNDISLPVRLASMRALGEIRETLAVVALAEQFEFYQKGSAGRAAIDALSRIAHPSSAGLFEAQTTATIAAHRRSAFEGLARLGAASAAPSIAGAIAGEREAEVLAAMAFALAAGHAGPAHLNYLVESLAEPRLAGQVLGYLVELGSAHAAALAGHVQHANPAVREQVAIALGFIGGREAEDALEKAAADADPVVNQAARAAQARMRLTRAPATAQSPVLP